MSTVTRVNFEPVRDVLHVERPAFPLTDPDLADPTNAVCLVDGEWMTLVSDKLVRAATITVNHEEATLPSWPLWNERGRTDVQAMGERKNVVLWGGFWEFNTRIYKDEVVGTGAVFAFGKPVKVATIVIGSRNYCGLVGGANAEATSIIRVGFVTRLPSLNGGKLRIRGGTLY